jgi:hypothetical protein
MTKVFYRLNSKYALYFKDKVVILEAGDVFQLAGFELSVCGNYNPFHYQNDIVRLPNSILERCDPVFETEEYVQPELEEAYPECRFEWNESLGIYFFSDNREMYIKQEFDEWTLTFTKDGCKYNITRHNCMQILMELCIQYWEMGGCNTLTTKYY